MDFAQEMSPPNYGDSGGEGQCDSAMSNKDIRETSSSTPESEETVCSDSGSDSEDADADAADHQAPKVTLTTSLDEMYESLINEIESEVNELIKIPFYLKLKASRVEKPTKKKRVKRGERVVQAIQAQAEALLTDPDSETDETESLTFERKTEWEAVQRASRLMNPETIQKRPRLVFWTDGSCEVRLKQNSVSKTPLKSGSAVTFKRCLGNQQPWVDCAYALFGPCKAHHTELFAIAMALRVACIEAQLYIHLPESEVSDPYLPKPDLTEEMLPKVYILTDWDEGLNWIKSFINGSPAKDTITTNIMQIIRQALESLGGFGVLVRLCWIPGHVGLEGNMRADQLAKATRKDFSAGSPTPRNPSEPFEAFLARPGRVKPMEDTKSSDEDVLYDGGNLEDFDELFTPTPKKKADAPGGDFDFDFDGWERIDMILDEMPLLHMSSETFSELNPAMVEGSDEMCKR